MKPLFKFGSIILVLGIAVAAASVPVAKWWQKRKAVQWHHEEITRGPLVSVVNSTGKIKPVKSVQVGSFVSGPIDPESQLVEFNQEVKKDDVLAVIDQRIYEAAVARDDAAKNAAIAKVDAAKAEQQAAEATVTREEATLKTRYAEVERVKAELKQAQNDEERAIKLARKNSDFISSAEMDQLKYKRMALEEQLNVAKSGIEQAKAAILQAQAAVKQAAAATKQAEAAVNQADANLVNSKLELGYTVIRSPVDGIVIDRKIEPGQTLAASFQTPELFVIAPRMREEIYVHASVDEADIGLIREAQSKGNPVRFTVDAYPDDLFEGRIKEVRFSSTTTENVVTYPVIVSAPNPDLKLLPGMTASISFQVDEKDNILKIPNAALRFYPDRGYVRAEDQKLLDGSIDEQDESQSNELLLSAEEISEAARKRRRRHVWVVENGMLQAIEVEIGISDNRFTEVIAGEVEEGMKLVTGIEPKKGLF